ncbi:unnamed protein product [Polarella glacialis]|uniref:Uncharacterized protein n=1 Tax=Polarella glacialis TaxID=89957 RepID=A0A813HB07_POLGL|nr:unnamed protein product [Polarella glacialis]
MFRLVLPVAMVFSQRTLWDEKAYSGVPGDEQIPEPIVDGALHDESIVPGQTVFIELFVNAGVFEDVCFLHEEELGCDGQYLQMTAMLNLASISTMVVQILFGGAFDAWGGQICAALGSAAVALGFLSISVLVLLIPFWPAANQSLSYAVIASIILTDCGAYLNSYAMVGLVWHYPKHQGLIMSLMNATYQAGGALANV